MVEEAAEGKLQPWGELSGGWARPPRHLPAILALAALQRKEKDRSVNLSCIGATVPMPCVTKMSIVGLP